jgi:hypothetical protein
VRCLAGGSILLERGRRSPEAADYGRRQITSRKDQRVRPPEPRAGDWARRECKKLAAWNRGIEGRSNRTDQKPTRGPKGLFGVWSGEAQTGWSEHKGFKGGRLASKISSS